MRCSRFILLLTFFSCFISASAQDSAILKGVITDPNGAAVAGAKVTAVNTLTREQRRATTDAQGHYAMDNLAPGSYTVTVSAKGFGAATREVRLSEMNGAVDFRLSISAVGETVTVEAETARAELERTPGGVAVVAGRDLIQTRAYNLRDVFEFTPGVLAQSRFGSDEVQISIRGSGLRNNYHGRGVNLLINGIPHMDADGFSDFEVLDFLAAQRVEVWKGANALRYGGATSGGAINLVTETGKTAAPFEFRVQGGSFGSFEGHVSTGGERGRFNYFLSFTDVELNGYREHSQQGRQRFYSNFNFALDDRTDFNLDIIYANIAEKYPGPLTREEFFRDPRAAVPIYVQQDQGRFVDYGRVGFGMRRRFGGGQEFSFNLFAQYRNLDHPIFNVLDQDTRTFGGEFRYSHTGESNRFVIGFSPQVTPNGGRRFENINGRPGAQTAHFDSLATNYGIYVENQFDIRPSFTLVTGARADWARRRFTDFFLSDGDQSDRRTFKAFSPKLGFVWRPRDQMQVFGNVSRSYEPPVLNIELISFGAPGFLPLGAQDTWQFEVGTRGRAAQRINYELTFFDLEVNDEIINANVLPFPGATFTIPSFRSAPETRHTGLELALDATLRQGLFTGGDALSARAAYTFSRFRYVDDPAYFNNYLPGAPRHLVRSELRYDHPRGFWIAPNVDWSPATYFMDSANTARNDKYAALNLRAGFDRRRWGIFFVANNLTDRLYSAAVQVDSAAGTFFEPANGRSAYVGLRYKFGR
ncbi:MAG TPA: TonB-dependent receptor [Blastocatellia bacterium]|jgi:iron complex outermembrane receptor protein|nr:TonB-dependent receptor [Blastocatellia bacterium]